MARDLLYNPTWQAGRNVTYELILGDETGSDTTYPRDAGAGEDQNDPHWLYRPRSNDVC